MEYIARIVNLSNRDEAITLLSQIGCDPIGVGIMVAQSIILQCVY